MIGSRVGGRGHGEPRRNCLIHSSAPRAAHPRERREKPVVRRSEPVVVAMSAFVSNRARHVRSRRKFLLIALTTAIVLNLLVMWILW
jgi:hypothetical protein